MIRRIASSTAGSEPNSAPQLGGVAIDAEHELVRSLEPIERPSTSSANDSGIRAIAGTSAIAQSSNPGSS